MSGAKTTEAELDPFEFRLNAYYKEECAASADGVIRKGTRAIAETCHMSAAKVVAARRNLVEMGLIEVTAGDGGDQPFAVKCSCGEHPVHVVNDTVHVVNSPDIPAPSVHVVNTNDARAPLPAFQEHQAPVQELKKQELKDKDQERDAPAHESTPLTFAHANGLGRTSNGHNPTVLAVKAHSVFQAYVRGRGGIEPEVPPSNAPGMLETLKSIQADIDAGRYGVQDVEDLTRFKVGIPHSKAFLLSYIKTDIADFVGARNSTNGNGHHASARASPATPTKPAAPSTSVGAPSLLPVRPKPAATGS